MLAELAAAEAGRVEARRLGEADRVVAEADLMGLGLKLGLVLGLDLGLGLGLGLELELGLGLGLTGSLQTQTLVNTMDRK